MKEQNLKSLCLHRYSGVPIAFGMKVETKEGKWYFTTRLFIASVWMLFVFFSKPSAQPGTSLPFLPQPPIEKGLFDTDEVLQITIKGSIRDLLNDRTDIPKDFSITLSYAKEDNKEISMPV